MGWMILCSHLRRDRSLFCLKDIQTGSGVLIVFTSIGTGVLSLEIKWPGHEVAHSPPFIAKVKNAWLHGMDRNTFPFTFC
jgi:hypothetical protein